MITTTEIAVRYVDGDLGGVVHNSVYAVWMEAARLDFLAAAGISYAVMQEHGLIPFLVDLHIQYHSPVRYPGKVSIATSVVSYGPKKLELHYTFTYEGRVTTEGTTFLVWGGPDGKSVNLAETLPELYAGIVSAAQPQELREAD